MTRSARSRLPGVGPVPLFAFLSGVLVLFTLLPILLLLPAVSGSSLAEQVATRGLSRAVGLSVAAATVSAGLAAVLGIPAGWLLARAPSRLAWGARAVVLLPTVLPPVAAGVLLLSAYGPGGAIGSLLARLGLGIVNSFGGIVVAQLFVASPFVVLTAEAAFRSVDRRLEEAAETLGQSRARTFRSITLPLAAPGVAAGLALGWMRALGEFGATVVLAYHPRTLPVHLYVELTGRGLRAALPVALVALVLAALAVGLAFLLARGRARGRTPALRGPARPARPAIVALPSPSPDAPPLLDLEIRRRIGDVQLEVALVARREIVSVFGPSGAGKTSLLRIVAGLDRPDEGKIRIDGRVLFDTESGVASVPARDRQAAMVFQEPALFPHMTVRENVAFARPGPGDPDDAIEAAARVDQALAVTRLDGLGDRRPDELSGGQRQRTELARALVRRPRVLLLDEPFSSLDFQMRERLHEDVRRVQRTFGLCVLYVTHDLRDACALGDRLAVIADGRLLQLAPPLEVLRRPATWDVARFVAVRNLLPGRIEVSTPEGLAVRCGPLRLLAPAGPFAAGESVHVCVRPEDVRIGPAEGSLPDGSGGRPPGTAFLARMREADLLGATRRLRLETRGDGSDVLALEAETPTRALEEAGLRPGAEVHVRIARDAVHLLERRAGAG
jgi:molybdate transport system permease protein